MGFIAVGTDSILDDIYLFKTVKPNYSSKQKYF